jgi:hypothetical protein
VDRPAQAAWAVARARAFETPTAVRLNPRIEGAAQRVPRGWARAAPPRSGAFVAEGGRPPASEGILYAQDQGSQLVAHLRRPVRLRRLHGPGEVRCSRPRRATGGDRGGEASAKPADHGRSRSPLTSPIGSPRRREPPPSPSFDSRAPGCTLRASARAGGTRYPVAPSARGRWGRQATRRRLLAAVARLVRPGGRLIYATCSARRRENGVVRSSSGRAGL